MMMKTVIIDFLALLLIFGHVDRIDAIRCGNECPFIFLTFNLTITPNVCPRIVEKKDAQCSLILELDFAGGGGEGVLMIQDRSSPDELKIQTSFGLRSNTTSSVIFYTCSTSDNCAYEFLRELFNAKLAQFNALAIRDNVTRLLYTSDPPETGVQCANQQCATNSFCQGQVTESVTAQSTSLTVENRFDCFNANATTNMLFVERSYSAASTRKTSMTIICNGAQCNSNNSLNLVYQYFDKAFELPANYSIMNTTSSSSRTLLDLHWQIFLIMVMSVQSLI